MVHSSFDAVGVVAEGSFDRLRGVYGTSGANQYRGFESLLARQDTGYKLSEPKTNTPLNALFCGVFRVNLLTSFTPQMSYLTNSGVLRAVSLETS